MVPGLIVDGQPALGERLRRGGALLVTQRVAPRERGDAEIAF